MADKPALFVTWDDAAPGGRAAAMAAYARATDLAVTKAAATGYRNVGTPGATVRDGFDRWDYDYFRPGEALPVRDRDIMSACQQAYLRFPEVKNMIDLMGDFACKGIDVVHPRKRVEAFGREWFHRRVNGPERSERILNLLYRLGNVVVKRLTARLPDTTMDVLRQARGADVSLRPGDPLPAHEIPFGYATIDPRWVEVMGGRLAPLVGANALRYGVRVPPELSRRLKNPEGFERNLVAMLPVSVLAGATSEGRLVPLPPGKVVVLNYKKDDFEVWAKPLTYPLLDHLQTYDRLKLADRAALDGVISRVRLWRLGNLENRIFPTEAAITRLSDLLANNVGGGSVDIIWGPELDLVETSTDVSQFLGQEKYLPTLRAIFQGLGVPPALTGLGGDDGFTNNAISLKVLIDRLEYGRLILRRFWEGELELVRARFGFREPFSLVFDQVTLSDEAAEKKLLMDLADRNFVSLEFLQERFGAIPEIERMRLMREQKDRKEGRLPPQAGPFHLDSQQKATLERSFVQQGHLTPGQVGLEVPDRKPGEKTPFELAAEEKAKQADRKAAAKPKKPKKANGRPGGAVDTAPRKKRRVTPRTALAAAADATAWAAEAQTKVERHTRAAFLAARGRENMRQLTAAEHDEYERFKFALLCRLPVGGPVTPAAVRAAVEQGGLSLPPVVRDLYQEAVARYAEREGGPPPAETDRQIRASVYAMYRASEEADPN